MRFYLNRSFYLNIFYIFLVFILVYKLYGNLLAGYEKESWYITEFLVNYQGGFVRRGIFGEILFYLHCQFGLNVYNAIMSFCVLSYIVLIAFITKNFLKKGFPILLLPLCFFLGNPIVTFCVIRKDIFLLLILILLIFFSLNKKKSSLFWLNLFFIFGILNHEAMGFYSFPILFLILKEKYSSDIKKTPYCKSTLHALCSLLPSLIIFFLVLYHKGSEEIAHKIWSSWSQIEFPYSNNDITALPTTIEGLTFSLKEGLLLTSGAIGLNMRIYQFFIWILVIVAIYYLLTNLKKITVKILNQVPSVNLRRETISNVVFLSLLSVSPLFILGGDYYRWIFMWVTISFSILILVPESLVSKIIPKFISLTTKKINFFLDSLLSQSQGFFLLICLFISVPYWDSGTHTSAVNIVLEGLSQIILKFETIFL